MTKETREKAWQILLSRITGDTSTGYFSNEELVKECIDLAREFIKQTPYNKMP